MAKVLLLILLVQHFLAIHDEISWLYFFSFSQFNSRIN